MRTLETDFFSVFRALDFIPNEEIAAGRALGFEAAS